MNKLSCGDHERIIAEVHLRSCENFQVSEHSIGKFCRSGDGSRGPDHRARVVGLLAAAEVALRHGRGVGRVLLRMPAVAHGAVHRRAARRVEPERYPVHGRRAARE